MKTRSAGIVETSVKSVEEKKPTVLGVRRLLQPLQQSATDKENLVGAGTGKLMSPRKDKHIKPETTKQPPKNKQPSKKNDSMIKKVNITVEDLTTEGSPSIAYYETLCEKQQKALEEKIIENDRLSKRVKYLEEENKQIKIVLEETKNLVQSLTEIINEDNDEE